jgi:sterol carrier protein 2
LYELTQVWHLRGWATNRAKPHTKYALQHNLGLGGAVVVTLYRRPDTSEAPTPEQSKNSQGKFNDGRKWAGYNPAIEARWIAEGELEKVQSKSKGSDKMVEGRKVFKGEQARL